MQKHPQNDSTQFLSQTAPQKQVDELFRLGMFFLLVFRLLRRHGAIAVMNICPKPPGVNRENLAGGQRGG
jgi:hypothetical protein